MRHERYGFRQTETAISVRDALDQGVLNDIPAHAEGEGCSDEQPLGRRRLTTLDDEARCVRCLLLAAQADPGDSYLNSSTLTMVVMARIAVRTPLNSINWGSCA